MDVGKRLMELREKAGLSRYRLAKVTGVAPSFIRDVENGRKDPTVRTLHRICSGLGVNLAEFFAEDGATVQPHVPGHLRPLLDQAWHLSPEQAEFLARFLEALNRPRGGKPDARGV